MVPTMVFPVIQSVLDPEALAAEIGLRYGLEGPVRCRLISRGMNDIYAVEHRGGRYALKISGSGKCSDQDLEWEVGYVQALARAGFKVATPAPCADGAPFMVLEAPEGPRQVVLMAWLEGDPLTKDLSVDVAQRLGTLLAKMHLATLDYVRPVPKSVGPGPKIRRRLPLLLAMLPSGSADRKFLETAAPAAVSQLELLDAKDLAWGACHGDMQYANVMVTADGDLAVFDFSDCGEDFLARDLSAFFWRNEFDGVDESINGAFLRAYQTVRPLNAAELAAQPLFRAIRHLVLTLAMAEFVNRIGLVPGFDKNAGHYVHMIRTHCARAGID